MALKTEDEYAQELVDALRAESADFADQSTDVHDTVRDGLGLAVARVLLSALSDAEVSGTDSGGDTLAGGTVS